MEPSQLEIRVTGDTDLGRLLDFFEHTAYAVEPLDERTVALTPPGPIDALVARREIGVYLRMFERVHPGIDASLVD